MPTSFPSRLTSAAPAHCNVGGAVKIAVSSRYSQLAANLRLETTYARLAASRPPAGRTMTGSRMARSAACPMGMGFTPSGAPERSNPNPLAWS